MKKELTEEQVAQLFEFTRRHYVEYYDVQVELVDHLASSIEAEWEKNPEISFDIALNNVFSGFGIFGFSDVVENKAKSVWKYQKSLWHKEFAKQFRWPNFLKLVTVWTILFMLFRVFPVNIVASATCIFIVILSLYFLIKEQRYLRKYGSKKLIITTQRFMYLTFSYIPCYIFQFFGLWIHKLDIWFITSLLTFLINLVFAYKEASKEIIKQARTQYPEAFKVSNS